MDVICYTDRSGLNITPLLWNLIKYKYNANIILIDEYNDKDNLEKQLKQYSSSLKWQIVKKGNKQKLGDLVAHTHLLSLPVSSIPIGDAISELAKDAKAHGLSSTFAKIPSALVVFAKNSLGDNISHQLADKCELSHTIIDMRKTDDWLSNKLMPHCQFSKSNFILYPISNIENYEPSPEDQIEVIAKCG